MLHIGDIIKDTMAYGTVKITDVFFSRDTDRIVYEIEDDSSAKFLSQEDELIPQE